MDKRSEESKKKKKKKSAPATNLATVASAASETPSCPAASASGAATQAATDGASARLVFGLSSRTNKLKHDEYAEQRLKRRQAPQQQTTSACNQSIGSQPRRESGVSMSSNQLATPRGQSASQASIGVGQQTKQTGESRPRRTSGGGGGGGGSSSSSSGGDTKARGKKSTQPDLSKPAKGSPGAEMTKVERAAPAEGKRSTGGQSDKKTTTGTSRPSSVRARSRSPDARAASPAADGRRKSLEEDLSTIKLEPTAHLHEQDDDSRQQQQQQPVLKARTQFNIRPPPQLSISSGKGGSVVGFAKARIYEKPAKPILPTNALLHQPSPLDPISSSPWSSALDDQGHIPKSISSGQRPPKQVMVSKARKEWEGGEPFTKCKSRKRLAAQANKKLFPGTWSMTSVVATQQLHLQQALAQASSAGRRSNIQETDPSVKVLTRGSVLERIQQYERVPASLSAGSSSSSSAILNDASPGADDHDDAASSYLLSRQSTFTSDSGDDCEAVISITSKPSNTIGVTSTGGKKALYRSRISSIQSQQNQAQSLTSNSAEQPQLGAKSSSNSMAVQQRRLSLRRRSSVLGASNNSTGSLIPKFYHPNGKPNTYEIEVQKRQIVACFENFPERSAQLEGPNARRHFNQIALACNFSEYFKVPLNLYVKHKLETCPHLFVSLNKSNNSPRQRKTSTVSLETNGSVSGVKRFTRSNSIALNQPSKGIAKSASIDSQPPPTDQGEAQNSARAEMSRITCDQFLVCWRDLISRSYDNAARFVHLLTFGLRDYLLPEDFVPLVQSIIDDHPGLKFLRAAPDFHMRYIQTVIARIYFCINKSWTGKMSLQELRKSNLLAVLQVLSQEEDINQITDYFSYEHFYVIYCKFWTLDQDHDLLISKEDLARHNDAAISSRIIERIFSNIVSKQIKKTGKMSYSDFVWFLIAEEDKKHPRSIEYWFRLMDLDGDGYISMYEMEYFYYEQMKRLELMNIEPLPFLDSACQILDLVNPREKNKISLADLKRTKMATIFFDTFINLEKYLEHESREFVSTRDVIQEGVVVSDWDRYASEEYENLVIEETAV